MKGKYGLKALLHLATLGPGGWAMSSEIAADREISKKFLDNILGELRSAGFVTTKKGRGGGYRLQRPPAEVRVGHVLRVLEGPLAPIRCASRTAHLPCSDCPDEAACSVRLLMLDVRNAITGVLDETSLADMLEREATATPEPRDVVSGA
jgi:Rrf2 family protein